MQRRSYFYFLHNYARVVESAKNFPQHFHFPERQAANQFPKVVLIKCSWLPHAGSLKLGQKLSLRDEIFSRQSRGKYSKSGDGELECLCRQKFPLSKANGEVFSPACISRRHKSYVCPFSFSHRKLKQCERHTAPRHSVKV